MKLIPLWAQAAIVAAVLAFVFGAGWKVASWKASGRYEKQAGRLAAAEALAAAGAQCEADLVVVQLDLTAKRVALLESEEAYAEAVARPPEIVVRYRDRVHTVREIIESEECHQAVGQLIAFVHSLPDLPSPSPP